MVKIVVTAPRGHMDRLIIEAAAKRSEIQIVGGVGTPGRDYIGMDIGIAAGLGRQLGATVYDDIEKIIDECDLVVDFSVVELSMKVMRACVAHGKALICGTTGFSDDETAALLAAGDEIPMMKAANTSYVVNVMRKLLGEAAAKLGDRCRIEIIDMHSETKLDAPSGTAIELAEEMAEHAPDKTYDDIVFHSVRAGNTPSTHRVIFGCMGEMMEISHDAYDWSCYAEGACDAVEFMAGKTPGLYTMEDVITG
ncbi:MAG: 4-hydroxy-tetrahydrodipicolinate reductase [Anaerovoracaceae bacterium]|nr:4-hydroxy-tetrahydrodipicolinate reductase [Anaerovoracaceae bacterium]